MWCIDLTNRRVLKKRTIDAEPGSLSRRVLRKGIPAQCVEPPAIAESESSVFRTFEAVTILILCIITLDFDRLSLYIAASETSGCTVSRARRLG
jgi:hypothetical protein